MPDDNQSSWLNKMGDVLGINPAAPSSGESQSTGTDEGIGIPDVSPPKESPSETEGGKSWFDTIKEEVLDGADEDTPKPQDDKSWYDSVKEKVLDDDDEEKTPEPQEDKSWYDSVKEKVFDGDDDDTATPDDDKGWFETVKEKVVDGVDDVVDGVNDVVKGVTDLVDKVTDDEGEDEGESDEEGTSEEDDDDTTVGDDPTDLTTVFVQVYDDEGNRVDGATVRLVGAGVSDQQTSNGTAVFPDVPPGTYVANAAKGTGPIGNPAEFTTPDAGGKSKTVIIGSRPEDEEELGSVTIEVVWENDEHAIGATVTLDGPDPISGVVQGNGRAIFAGLKHGSYRATANQAGVTSETRLFQLDPGENESDRLRLNGLASMAVDVVWAETSDRVPGATVTVTGPSTKSESTGDGGRIVFLGLIPGKYQVQAEKDGRTSDSMPVSLSPSGEGAATLGVPWCDIEVYVNWAATPPLAEGGPVAGATVKLRGARMTQVTDGMGFTRFPKLDVKRFHVQAFAPGTENSGSQPLAKQVDPAPNKVTKVDITLVPGGSGSLGIKVLWDDGTEANGAMVDIGTGETTVDANGYIQFDNLETGEYDVKVRMPTAKGDPKISDSKTVTVKEGWNDETFTLKKPSDEATEGGKNWSLQIVAGLVAGEIVVYANLQVVLVDLDNRIGQRFQLHGGGLGVGLPVGTTGTSKAQTFTTGSRTFASFEGAGAWSTSQAQAGVGPSIDTVRFGGKTFSFRGLLNFPDDDTEETGKGFGTATAVGSWGRVGGQYATGPGSKRHPDDRKNPGKPLPPKPTEG